MEIKITKQLAEAVGFKTLVPYGLDLDRWKYDKDRLLSLNRLSEKQLTALAALFEPKRLIRGTVLVLKDIETWKAALKGKLPKARTVKQGAALMTEYIRRIPGHRIFKKNDAHGEAWLCSYVRSVKYCEPWDHREKQPPYVRIELVWDELGSREEKNVLLYSDDVIHRTSAEALASAGWTPETPEFRKRYLAELESFLNLHTKVGLQCLATGVGTDDIDGNGRARHEDSWYWRRTNRILLEREGVPSRVVVDVFKEEDKERDREKHVSLDAYFWSSPIAKLREDDEETEPDEDLDERPEIEIPCHPFVACFDLKRHQRLRVHVSYLTPYVYDTTLSEKLVLPADVKDLVKILIAQEDSFKDVVAGKSGGAIVMCAGVPGVGKTLTAEVYAESMERPLYSVQASQLGTDPDYLEGDLLKIFARSARWNAILLIDEADVYVRCRGDDLTQNAIVGVLLRVLEYYPGVLFLTTNRANTVDDAVASRCVARIDYELPTPPEQARIWRILADSSGIDVPPEVISDVIDAWPDLSGRDVKNLLKLARLVSKAKKEPITFETIKFVKRFKSA